MFKRNRNQEDIKTTKAITLDKSGIDQGSQNWVLITCILVCAILSSVMGFAGGFNISVPAIIVLLVGGVVSILVQLTLNNKRILKYAGIAVVLVIGLYVGIFIQFIANGFLGIINQIISTINENMAEAHIKYVVSQKGLKTNIVLAMILVTIIYAIIVNILARYGHSIIVAFLILASTMANMWYKGQGQALWVAMGLICCFLLFYYTNIKLNSKSKSGIIMAVVISIASVIFTLAIDYSGFEFVDDIKEDIIYTSENIIYGKSDYPQGQFKRFDEVNNDSEEIRLTVSMSKPTELHLKGYVGSQYTNKGWKDNDENMYAGDYMGMIDWFRNDDFYPLTQLAYYLGYSVQNGELEPEKIDEGVIYVTNQTASSKYQYVPENLKTMSNLADPKQDVNFRTPGWFDIDDEYSYEIITYNDSDYMKMPAVNWLEEGKTNKTFSNAEYYYHAFAEQFYTMIPDEEKQILAKNIPACGNNVSSAIATIRKYLKEQMEYSEEHSQYTFDNDFLNKTLLVDRKGYSAHFATVATLMFRYYGIPARYVEGYYIRNENDFETVDVTASDAHAWVEVYVKGMGFIPVEVTPGFYDEDNLASVAAQNDNQNNAGGGQGTGGGQRKDDDKEINISLKVVLITLAIILLAALLITILILVIRRFIIVKKRREKIASDDLAVKLATSSRYLEEMCTYTNSEFIGKLPKEVLVTYEKAKFSSHPLEKEKVVKAVNYQEIRVNEIWQGLSFIMKIKVMFIKALK